MKFNPEPKRDGIYCWAILEGEKTPEPVLVERVKGKLRVIALSYRLPIDGNTVIYGDELVLPEVSP